MNSIVLVTYATRTGSTEEVARAIADVLREHDLTAELQPATEVQTLEGFGAVVLVAPLYMGQLHKDARRFLSVHRPDLMKLPVALFVPGPVQDVEKDWAGARQQLDQELAKLPWLTPVARHVIGGKFDPAKLGFPFNLIPPLKKIPANDLRDWKAIRSLAADLAATLQPVLHP